MTVINAAHRFGAPREDKDTGAVTTAKDEVAQHVGDIVPQDINAQIEEGSQIISEYLQQYLEAIFGVRVDESNNQDPAYMAVIGRLYNQVAPAYKGKTDLELSQAMLHIINRLKAEQRSGGNESVDTVIRANNYSILKHYIILDCILTYRANPGTLPKEFVAV